MAGLTSKNPLQKSLSHRAPTNDDPFGRGHKPLTAYDDIDARGGSSCCGTLCSSCCACISLIIGFLLLLSLLVGGILYAFLQSNLPEVHLHRLDIHGLKLSSNSKRDILLTADFEVRLNVTNKSGHLKLGYGPMTAAMTTQGIKFPDVRVRSMHQRPRAEKDLRVRWSVKKKKVEEASGRQLRENAKMHMLLINVVVKGRIDFDGGNKMMQGFPMKIECSAIDQSVVDAGKAPPCNVKFSFIS